MSDRFHAFYDYLVSVFVILSPFIFGFYHSQVAMEVTIGFGVFNFLSTLLTGHKASLFHKTPMYFHLGIDTCWGLLLAMSPWFFGFSSVVFLPQLIVGFLAILVAIITHLPVQEQSNENAEWE